MAKARSVAYPTEFKYEVRFWYTTATGFKAQDAAVLYYPTNVQRKDVIDAVIAKYKISRNDIIRVTYKESLK